MREPKPSDIQALSVIYENLRNISVNISRINGELTRMYKEIGNYINQEIGETNNVQTTSGSASENNGN